MSKHGFTLLEILITIVILALGTTALLSAFSQAIFTSGIVSDLRTATALSQAKMEDLKDTAFASIVNETRAEVSGFTGFDRQVIVTASPAGTNSNLKQADTTVYYKTKGGERSSAFTTYFVNKNN